MANCGSCEGRGELFNCSGSGASISTGGRWNSLGKTLQLDSMGPSSKDVSARFLSDLK